MKCPKCMKKPLDWKVPVVNLCPMCGCEMQERMWDALPADEMDYETWFCPNCGHEKKVGGEKPPVVDTEEDDPWGEKP